MESETSRTLELEKPRWFSAVVVSAIVVGSLVGCCGLFTVASLVANSAIQDRVDKLKGFTAAEEQDDYFEELERLQEEAKPTTLTITMITMLHGLAMIIAGALAMKRRSRSRGLLSAVLLAGLVVELMSAVVGLRMTQRQSGAIEKMSLRIMESEIAPPPDGGEPETEKEAEQRRQLAEITASIMRGASIFGYLTIIGWLIMKGVYFILCARYLARREVVEYFERAPPEPQTT